MAPKKNPYSFTIGFNPKHPNHVQAAQILNQFGRGEMSDYLARAILAYEGKKSEGNASIDMDSLRLIVREMLQEESKPSQVEKQESHQEDQVIDVSEKVQKDPALAQSLTRSLAAFRRSS